MKANPAFAAQGAMAAAGEGAAGFIGNLIKSGYYGK